MSPDYLVSCNYTVLSLQTQSNFDRHCGRSFVDRKYCQYIVCNIFICIVAQSSRLLYIYIYIYVWKLNQTVLELDFRSVTFLFFPRRDLNPHHLLYIYIINGIKFILKSNQERISNIVFFYFCLVPSATADYKDDFFSILKLCADQPFQSYWNLKRFSLILISLRFLLTFKLDNWFCVDLLKIDCIFICYSILFIFSMYCCRLTFRKSASKTNMC